MSLTALLLLVLGCVRAPATGGGQRGVLGIRYQVLPEGLVVTDVLPGTAAQRAGLGTGDLIVAVSGTALLVHHPTS